MDVYNSSGHQANKDGTYLEVQDDGPDEAEREFGVPVDDVFSSDVDQLDLLVPEEVEGHLDILQHVEAHTASFARLYVTNKIQLVFIYIYILKNK